MAHGTLRVSQVNTAVALIYEGEMGQAVDKLSQQTQRQRLTDVMLRARKYYLPSTIYEMQHVYFHFG
jgi:hypothetical protein